MASVIEGILSSRRRRSRSRSESGKQLHARFGDNGISAPQTGGWSQQHHEEDGTTIYQPHGSPDSQKTLVSDSTDACYDPWREKIENIMQVVRAQRFSGTPMIKEVNGQITITIPTESRPEGKQAHIPQAATQQHYFKPLDQVISVESRPALPPLSTSDNDVITVEARDVVHPYRTTSPIVHTQSPVYDDVSTFYTRGAYADRSFGLARLPHIQTSVPPSRSQPASALSMLSPVQEKYNGQSESNNASPMESTPIAQRMIPSVPQCQSIAAKMADIETLTQSLERFRTPSATPLSQIVSPIESSDSDTDKPWEINRVHTRPSSRGPGIGDVAYMRCSSRGPGERRPESRNGGARSRSREPAHHARSVEPRGRSLSIDPKESRALSREQTRHREQSRGRSKDIGSTSRAQSREPRRYRGESVDKKLGNLETLDSFGQQQTRDRTPMAIQRISSPESGHRRTFSRDNLDVTHRASPVPAARRAFSRDNVRRRPLSGEFTRRAASVGPALRKGTPEQQNDNVPISRRGTPLIFQHGRFVLAADESTLGSSSGSGSESSGVDDEDDMDGHRSSPFTADDPGFDTEATDIDTETDDAYYTSRKGWNGRATTGATGKGLYGDIEIDYKAIAKDVEADQAIPRDMGGINIGGIKVNITKVRTDKVDKTKEKEKEKEKERKEASKRCVTTDLVPTMEDLWG